MQLQQIEGFLEVVKHGNVTRAANALYLTQPALTARLRGLEGELGTQLFRRTRRGMDLTEAGRAFVPYAERALVALRDGRELVTEMGRGTAGDLIIGAAPAISTYVLPALLVRFTERHPNVHLSVRTGHSEEIVEMAVRNEIGIGLIRRIRHPLLETHPLYDDELVLVADPDHPFARAGRVPLERVSEARLILFDRTSSYYDLTNALFREAGVAPRGVMELDNIDAAKQMVCEGLGVALLPQTAIAAELSDGRLRAVKVEGSRPIRRPIVAIRRRDLGPPSGTVASFMEVLGGIREILPRPLET
jgi:DNA-binding transcriptional LysR family regulator